MVSRYNRQELLIGKEAQRKLTKSIAVVVGLGALGTAAAEILARAGIGRLKIVDRDVVELTDLQRQLLYDEKDVGKPKALAASDKLRRINSKIEIIAVAADVDHKNIVMLVGKPDVVLDCTDNLETRFLLNECCLKNKLAWVHAAAIRDSAQLMLFDFRRKSARQPCYACVFGKSAPEGTCDTVGVLSSATAIIAAMQANEAIKLLTGAKVEDKLLRLSVWNNTLDKLAIKKNSRCESCGGNYDYLNGRKGSETVSLCGRDSYQIKGKPVNLAELKKRLQRMNEAVTDFGGCLSFRNITIFSDGRALVKAESVEKAKADYARYVGN